MSILLGVAQMNLGIILSFCNAKFFRNSINIWCHFIAEMIFLNGLFGFLSVLIIIKWWTGLQADLYHVMIYTFLGPMDDLGENQLFPGQKTAQIVLLLLALVAVPWMLIPKPFLLKMQHDRHRGHCYAPLQDTEDSLLVETNQYPHGHEEFEISEIFVHQLIHTIEFVLGAVSNTASYLHLWALRYGLEPYIYLSAASQSHEGLQDAICYAVLLSVGTTNNVISCEKPEHLEQLLSMRL